jgi:biopolymer transport protein ExbD
LTAPQRVILRAMKKIPEISAALSILAMGVGACSSDAPEPPAVVAVLSVAIDAENNCSLENARVDCAQVASIIKSRYPTSKPRVDLCLHRQTRYEAAVEVMNSVTEAGFTVGRFACGKPDAG